MVNLGDRFYRLENYGDYIQREEFIVTKVTPKGVKIQKVAVKTTVIIDEKQYLILNNSNKKYAWPTLELAVNSFFIRKKREFDY